MEKALDAISKGGVIALVGGVIGRGLGFLNRAMIAKFFGPAAFGLFVLGLMWVTIIRTLSTGGFVPALKKFVPLHLTNDDGRKVTDSIFTIFTISLLISIIGGILLFTFSRYIAVQIFDSKSLIPILKVMAFVIPLHTLFRLVLHLYLAFKEPKYKVLFKVGMYALFLPIVIFIVFIQGSVLALTLGHLVRILAILIISLVIFEKKVYPMFKKKIKAGRKIDLKIKSILDYSLPLMFSAALIMMMGKADTFMLGYFKTEEIVGIYNLVLPIASLLTIFLASMNQVFFPVISSLHAEEKFSELASTFSTITRWNILLLMPFFFFVVTFSRPLLAAFFPQYVDGWRTLIILGVGYMSGSIVGPVGKTLKTYGKTTFIFKINSLLLVLNISLNLILIPIWGLEGAAVATAVAYSLNNILERWKVRDLISISTKFSLLGKYTVAALLPVSWTYTVFFLLPSSWWLLILLLGGFLVSYLLLLILFNSFLEEDIYLFEIVEILLRKLKLNIGIKKLYHLGKKK